MIRGMGEDLITLFYPFCRRRRGHPLSPGRHPSLTLATTPNSPATGDENSVYLGHHFFCLCGRQEVREASMRPPRLPIHIGKRQERGGRPRFCHVWGRSGSSGGGIA